MNRFFIVLISLFLSSSCIYSNGIVPTEKQTVMLKLNDDKKIFIQLDTCAKLQSASGFVRKISKNGLCAAGKEIELPIGEVEAKKLIGYLKADDQRKRMILAQNTVPSLIAFLNAGQTLEIPALVENGVKELTARLSTKEILERFRTEPHYIETLQLNEKLEKAVKDQLMSELRPYIPTILSKEIPHKVLYNYSSAAYFVNHIVFNGDDSLIALAVTQGGIIIIEKNTGTVQRVHGIKDDEITALEFMPNGSSVVFGTNRGFVFALDRDKKEATELLAIDSPIDSIGVASNGNILAAGARNGKVVHINIQNKQGIEVPHAAGVSECVFDRTGNRLAVAYVDKRIHLFDGATMAQIDSLHVNNHVIGMQFKGKELVVATVEETKSINKAVRLPGKTVMFSKERFNFAQTPSKKIIEKSFPVSDKYGFAYNFKTGTLMGAGGLSSTDFWDNDGRFEFFFAPGLVTSFAFDHKGDSAAVAIMGNLQLWDLAAARAHYNKIAAGMTLEKALFLKLALVYNESFENLDFEAEPIRSYYSSFDKEMQMGLEKFMNIPWWKRKLQKVLTTSTNLLYQKGGEYMYPTKPEVEETPETPWWQPKAQKAVKALEKIGGYIYPEEKE